MEEWRDYASCKDVDTSLFFDDFEDATIDERIEMINMCAQCPVINECDNEASSRKDTEGFWAGYYWRAGKRKNPLKIRSNLAIRVAA